MQWTKINSRKRIDRDLRWTFLQKYIFRIESTAFAFRIHHPPTIQSAPRRSCSGHIFRAFFSSFRLDPRQYWIVRFFRRNIFQFLYEPLPPPLLIKRKNSQQVEEMWWWMLLHGRKKICGSGLQVVAFSRRIAVDVESIASSCRTLRTKTPLGWEIERDEEEGEWRENLISSTPNICRSIQAYISNLFDALQGRGICF